MRYPERHYTTIPATSAESFTQDSFATSWSEFPGRDQLWIQNFRSMRINYVEYTFQPALSGPIYVPEQTPGGGNANYLFGQQGYYIARDEQGIPVINSINGSFTSWPAAVALKQFKFVKPNRTFRARWSPAYRTQGIMSVPGNPGFLATNQISKPRQWLDTNQFIATNVGMGAIYLACNQPSSTTSLSEFSGQVYHVICKVSISLKNRIQ